jgi:DNA-binding transcriptional regulator YdaS (Cro superfamily)
MLAITNSKCYKYAYCKKETFMTLNEFLVERGAKSRLARHLNKPSAFISQIASGERSCTPSLAPSIEAFSEGKVTRKELRPDDWHLLWPELVDESIKSF